MTSPLDDVKVGDLVLYDGFRGVACLRVVRVTKAQFFTKGAPHIYEERWWKKTGRLVGVGSPDAARPLLTPEEHDAHKRLLIAELRDRLSCGEFTALKDMSLSTLQTLHHTAVRRNR